MVRTKLWRSASPFISDQAYGTKWVLEEVILEEEGLLSQKKKAKASHSTEEDCSQEGQIVDQ